MRKICRSVKGAALLAALVLAPGARAGAPLSLAEAEQKALVANPGLQAAKLEAVAAGQRTAETFGRHFGELDLVGTYNHFERDRIVVPMAQELFADPALGMSQLPWDRNQLHYGLTWQVPLLAAGNLHEGDRIARLAQSASEHQSLYTRDQILYYVRASYRNALIVRHALDAAEAYRQTLDKDDTDARLKVKIGAMASVDAAKITYALRGAEAQAADLQTQSATAQALLAALLGEEPPADGFDLGDIPGEPDGDDTPAGDDTQAALAGRDDLLATRAGTQVLAHRKHLAVAAFSPQLVVQGTYLRNEAPSLHDPLYTREWAVMMKLPLFTGLSRIHAVREADANLRAARQRERAKELEVAAQVVDARGRLVSARALFAAGQAQRDLGREVARVEHVKLEQGTGRMEDYLAAREQELAGETAYWRGLYAYQTAVDYLEFVTARGGNHE
ncbi:MAG: TolC family protein [Candidatus Krumholzibacteriia bacterium]